MWCEDASRYQWIGSLDFGDHSIHDFEVYVDLVTRELVVADHDYPENIMAIEDLVEFSKDYTDDIEAQTKLYKLLLDHNMDELLGWKQAR